MNIHQILVYICITLSLTACVYLPVVDENASAKCNTVTKSMSLDKVDVEGNMSVRCRNEGCAAVLAGSVVVSAGSAIVSGTIVLTGNTIHWLEYQGTCSDGYLNKAKNLFLDAINKS